MAGIGYYPGGYREDEELYVYDQSCENCTHRCCPMEFDSDDDMSSDYERREREESVAALRREDAIIRDGRLIWCIYWHGGRRR